MGKAAGTPSDFLSVFIRVHPWLKKFLQTAALLLCIPRLFAAAPEIESISPLAIRPGVATEITLSGNDLAEATQLWTSFPSKVESLGAGKFRITTDAATGLGVLRVFGSNGISNLRFIALDPLPGVTEVKTNKTRATAQSVEVGSAVDGRSEELSYDWFKVRATKGQRVPVETIAARLGSKFDSVLRVASATGRELARNDDAPGGSGDSALTFIAPETGDYFVEVRDVNYGGGAAFFYRLRVGGVSLMAARTARSNMEQEPNDTVAKATKISPPVEIHGTFGKPGDRDRYEFIAGKGERLEFRAASRSLGSSCDLVLQLDSAEGQRLARSNPSASDEGALTHTFTNGGTYRLTVHEASGAHGSNLFYRITARPAAGFALTLDTDRVNVPPGGAFDLKITAARGDHKGAIQLALENFPGAKILTNGVIAEGKTNVTMKVRVPESLKPGTWQTFSVVGMSTRSNNTARVLASTAPALRRQLPLLLHVPPELDGAVALGVTRSKDPEGK
jgi:hypothetical protein